MRWAALLSNHSDIKRRVLHHTIAALEALMQLEMEPLYDSTKNVHNRQLTKRAVYGHFVFRFIVRMRF